MPVEKKPRGRPTAWSPEKGREITDRLSAGEPLAQICRDESMPAVRTVYDWRDKYEDFSADFARGRDEGFDAIALDCLKIADDASNDVKWVGQEGEEREVLNAEFVQRSKLRIETRLKLLAKWDPRRYGDKLALGQADDLGPLTVIINKPE